MTQLKKNASTYSFTNVLNQSTDAISNAQFNRPDISSSFIKDDHEDVDVDDSFASIPSSNMPSFDGSKMFAKKNE